MRVDQRPAADGSPTGLGAVKPNLPSTASPADFIRGSQAHSDDDDVRAGTDPLAGFDPAIRDFRFWAVRFARETNPSAKRGMMEDGHALARGHREAIRQLIPTDPRRALLQALPMELRQELPKEIVAELEERINTRAVFGVYAAFSGDPEPIRRVVETPEKRYNTFVYGRRLAQATTRDCYLVGIAVDDTMALDERPLRVLETRESPDPAKPVVRAPSDYPHGGSAPAAGDEPTVHTAPPFTGSAPLVEAGGNIYQLCCSGALAPFERELIAFEGGSGGPVHPSHPVNGTDSTGAKSLLYLRLAFPNAPLTPQTEAAAYDMMSQVNAWFVDSSYGKLYLLTTVAPLVVLPRTEAWYNTVGGVYTLRDDALAAAKELGYDGDAHDHVIFAYNGGPGNFKGLANVGGKDVWLKNISVGTATHELAHNFGLWHANSWQTSGQSVIGAGTNLEYGNSFDTMGVGSPASGHFNVSSKNQIRWLGDEFVHNIGQSGTYRLFAFDQPRLDPSRRLAIKLRKDSERFYWAEFRQLFGPANPWLQAGILLNWSPWNKSAGGTQLLDTTPGTAEGLSDAALTIGRTFSDFDAGLHLTPVGKGGTVPESIDVVVNLGGFPGNQPPAVSLAADQTSTATGVVVSFAATAADPDADVLAYSWDFGDKTFSNTNSPQVSKSWTAAGDYVVRCLVSDMKGGTASDSVLVRVGTPGTFAASGQITSGGQPLPNVRVHNGKSGANYRGTYTDSDGTFLLTGLSAGTVTLSAVLQGYSITPAFANPITVGPDVSGANFTAQETVRVSMVATDPAATEGADPATITLARSGSTASPLKVRLSSITGTAGEFEYSITPSATYDFGLLAFVFTIPVGQSSLDLSITAANDGVTEGPETLTLEIQSGSNYEISGSNTATVTLFDMGSALPTVSIKALDADAGETGDTATFLVTRVGAATSALTVPVSFSGSAVNGSDYVAVENSVTIPAGQSSAPILVIPINDPDTEGVEDVAITLAVTADYLISPNAGVASAFIVDDDIPTLTLVATDSAASETNQDPATFVVTRSGDTSAPLAVDYAISGSAQHGVDYAVLPGVLTIPSGSSFGSITVVPVDDTIGEPQQTVAIQIRGGSRYVTGIPSSATAFIADNDVPVVSVGVSDAACAEPANAGQFRFTTSGSGSGTIIVRYTVSGTATPGTDFTPLQGTLSMGRNTTATVNVNPLDDQLPEDLETITISVDPDPTYTTFLEKTATLNLFDDEQNLVDVTPAAGSPGEGKATSLTYYLSRQGSTAAALTVNFAMTGTASNGVDYQAVSGTAVIPAGKSSVNVTAAIIDDPTPEGSETAVLTLAPSLVYGLGIASATHHITDNEASEVQVRFSNPTGSCNEDAGTANIPLTLSAASAVPVTIDFAITGGSATGGIDYGVISGSLTFDPGQTTRDIPLTIIDDLFHEPPQTVVIGIRNPSNGSIGTSSHTLTIHDNDNPPPVTVGFAAAASSGGENFPSAVLLVSLSAPHSAPVTVNYSASGGTATGGGVDYRLDPGTLTFAPGETVKPLSITITGDPIHETDETILVTLDSSTEAALNANATHAFTIRNIAVTLAVTPATGLDSAGPGGGPFSPEGATYTLSNTADTPLNWTVSADAPWIDFSATTGTLEPGASMDVLVSFNLLARALLPQTWTATVAFANTTNHSGNTTREVSLNVQLPPPVANRISLTGEGAVLQLWGVPGTATLIERSLDLDRWDSIGVKTAPANGVIEFTDPSPPGGKAFYRSGTPQP